MAAGDGNMTEADAIRRAIAEGAGGDYMDIAAAVRRTFHDCDLNIIDEICHAGDPSIAWLVLADWLEERDDDRGRWIRSHRLDLAQQWNGRQEVVEFLLSASVGSTN